VRHAALLATFATLTFAACGGDSPKTVSAPPPDHAVPPRPRAQGPALTEPAPRWAQEFCAEVVRRSSLACPGRIPSGLEAPALAPERPSADGYRLVAGGWVIAGRRSARDDLPLADQRPRRGVLRWTARGGVYTLRRDPPADRDQLLRVARSFGRG
jgi:hypothetical protein